LEVFSFLTLFNQFYLKFIALLNELRCCELRLSLEQLQAFYFQPIQPFWKQLQVNYVFDGLFSRYFEWRYLYHKHEWIDEQLGLIKLVLGNSLLVKLKLVPNFHSF